MMINRTTLQLWVEGYLKAWHTNDPEDIDLLFTSQARYYTAPYRPPWEGRAQIVAGWLDRKDEPGDFEFRYEILGLEGNTGFVRGWTEYLKEQVSYSNLWVIHLNEQGECLEFIEWWMKED